MYAAVKDSVSRHSHSPATAIVDPAASWRKYKSISRSLLGTVRTHRWPNGCSIHAGATQQSTGILFVNAPAAGGSEAPSVAFGPKDPPQCSAGADGETMALASRNLRVTVCAFQCRRSGGCSSRGDCQQDWPQPCTGAAALEPAAGQGGGHHHQQEGTHAGVC